MSPRVHLAVLCIAGLIGIAVITYVTQTLDTSEMSDIEIQLVKFLPLGCLLIMISGILAGWRRSSK